MVRSSGTALFVYERTGSASCVCSVGLGVGVGKNEPHEPVSGHASGGLSLSHLFLRQVGNRFWFLHDVKDPFLCTVCHMKLARALPDFVVTSAVFSFGIE